jgi:hypothetical protein
VFIEPVVGFFYLFEKGGTVIAAGNRIAELRIQVTENAGLEQETLNQRHLATEDVFRQVVGDRRLVATEAAYELPDIGLPGNRYVTEINIDEMIWWFREPADRTLFTLRNGQVECIQLPYSI